MAKKVLKHKASDHEYYHPDFHIALDHGLRYLQDRFGVEAVKEYLAKFAAGYFASLKRGLATEGLKAIREHYERIYKAEHAVYTMLHSKHELNITLTESPAVMHMRARGHDVSTVYHETVATVNKEICRLTDFDCELVDYHPGNGAYQLRFYKRTE